MKSPVTIKVTDSRRSKVVHSNRLQCRIQAMANSSESTLTKGVLPPWAPPQVEHFIEETESTKPLPFTNSLAIAVLQALIKLEDKLTKREKHMSTEHLIIAL